MGTVARNGTTLYFEEFGSGYPMLLIAPGGLNSTIEMWQRASIDPIACFSDDFRLIAMDQRNAGRSKGPLPNDPWRELAEDQLAICDHLGLEQVHLFGCCIGGPYVLRFAHDYPDRVRAVVAEQPMGLDSANQPGWIERSREWARELAAQRADIAPEDAISFVERMWSRDFVVSLERHELEQIQAPLAVLPGVDEIHPSAIGREIGRLVPNAITIEPWKDGPHLDEAVGRLQSFLKTHTPANTQVD